MRNAARWALAAWLGITAGAVSAETVRYSIQLPVGQPVTYELQFEVTHAGSLSVQADWSGSRRLSLKLIPPGQNYGKLLRSGASPQSLETQIEPNEGGLGAWRLRIHAASGRGAGEGLLVIETPEPDDKRQTAPQYEAEPAPPIDPWMLAPDLPSTVPVVWLPFLQATEGYRSTIVGAEDAPPEDVCQWQSLLMRYLAIQRRALLEDRVAISDSTAKLLAQMVQTVDSVEALRTSDDPLIIGPPPSDSGMRNAWVRLRTIKIFPVEHELDEMLGMVQRNYSSQLAQEQWPIRFVSCLTACERFFEQRSRLGEKRAENGDLALSQWPRILAASRALAELSELQTTPLASN